MGLGSTKPRVPKTHGKVYVRASQSGGSYGAPSHTGRRALSCESGRPLFSPILSNHQESIYLRLLAMEEVSKARYFLDPVAGPTKRIPPPKWSKQDPQKAGETCAKLLGVMAMAPLV